MAKVKRELVVENGMHFDEILAFKTESCVGIWDENNGEFVVMRAGELTLDVFETVRIPYDSYGSLQDLDNIVYEEVNEHIEEVSMKVIGASNLYQRRDSMCPRCYGCFDETSRYCVSGCPWGVWCWEDTYWWDCDFGW